MLSFDCECYGKKAEPVEQGWGMIFVHEGHSGCNTEAGVQRSETRGRNCWKKPGERKPSFGAGSWQCEWSHRAGFQVYLGDEVNRTW